MNKDFLLFESELRNAFASADAQQGFVDALAGRLRTNSATAKSAHRPNMRLRPSWVVILSVIALLIASILFIGPDKVYAEFLKLLGYIPGIGIVDQAQSVRVLSEPVRVTRDGVVLSVNQALLTSSGTQIEYGVSGVPLSAYPRQEAIAGCMDQEYILLPDGTRISSHDPIPLDVDSVTFVVPCIFNTLPDTVPTDWRIPLTFIPLPSDTTVFPVQELTSSPIPSALATQEPISQTSAPFEFDKVVTTEDGYILIGWFRSHLAENQQLQVSGVQYLDSNKNVVRVDYPQDIDLSSSGMPLGMGDSIWAIQFKTSDVAFPLTIRYTGKIFTRVETAPLEFEFDAGLDPKPGQEWTINHDFTVAGSTFRLVSIRATDSGYSFQFESEPELEGVDIQVEGYQPVGGGGGPQTRSLDFETIPTGKLKLIFSNFYQFTKNETWEGTWQPDPLPALQPTSSSTSSTCVDVHNYAALPSLPDGLDGWMLLTQLDPERSLILQSMDGKEIKLAIPQTGRGSMSPDGTQIAYPDETGTVIVDIATGKTFTLPGSGGIDWSPDGKFIATVNTTAGYGIFLNALDGSSTRQLTNLGYEAIAGWSPDSSTLYYAIPDAGGKGFMLRAMDIKTGRSRDLFVLENSSGKGPFAAVSPDGAWVAYRAKDNSSLYLKGMDGSPARLLLDRPATAISGIVWEKDSHLIGVSLITPETSDGEIILLQFENCETYKLTGLHGELDGIYIP